MADKIGTGECGEILIYQTDNGQTNIEVKRDIERKVTNEIESLYELGFRGADLLTACFGQAVSEFGSYQGF